METCQICFEDYRIENTKDHQCPDVWGCGACGELCTIEEGTVAINQGLIEFTHSKEICGAQDEIEFTYDLCVRFSTNRELTEDEKGFLQHQVIAQVEEPVTLEGEDVTYTTNFYGSDIDEVKGAN